MEQIAVRLTYSSYWCRFHPAPSARDRKVFCSLLYYCCTSVTLPIFLMVAPKACHNCRSRRLRCDRSVPRCIKCASNGQECLGYGKLYKWVDNKAPEDQGARNNLVYDISHLDNKAYTGPKQTSEKVELRPQALHFPLLDPLFQDLDLSSRYYLNYCQSCPLTRARRRPNAV